MPDPTKPFPPAQDPWAGRAPVPQPPPPPMVAETASAPQVIFVEVRRKRRWPWVAGIFLTWCLLCCGLCGVIVAPVFKEYPSTIAATPAEVAGLKRDNNGIVQLIAAEANYRIQASPYVDGSFAEKFDDPRNQDRSVIVFGGTGLIWDPEKTLADTIRGAGENVWGVEGFPPGKHGGILKCGDGKDNQGKQVVMCAWIDHGSMGIGVFYGKRSRKDSADFLRTLREAVIVRP